MNYRSVLIGVEPLTSKNLETAIRLNIMQIKVSELVASQNYPARDCIWVAPDR